MPKDSVSLSEIGRERHTSLSDIGRRNLSDMPFEDIVRALISAPSNQQEMPQPQFPPRMGIDIVGRGITSPILAGLQLADGHGLSGDQLDRNQAMYGPLYGHALSQYPEIVDKKMNEPPRPFSYGAADRRSLAEDLNGAKIKFDNWRKAQTGQELTPQERVTQSFVDFRNPNSWF